MGSRRSPVVSAIGEFLYRITEPVLRPIAAVLQHDGVCVARSNDSNDGLCTKLDGPANDCAGTSAHADEASAAHAATRMATADGKTTP